MKGLRRRTNLCTTPSNRGCLVFPSSCSLHSSISALLFNRTTFCLLIYTWRFFCPEYNVLQMEQYILLYPAFLSKTTFSYKVFYGLHLPFLYTLPETIFILHLSFLKVYLSPDSTIQYLYSNIRGKLTQRSGAKPSFKIG